MEGKSTQLLRQFVEDWRKVMTNDEPIAGSDAVDYLADFWQRAEKVLNEIANQGATAAASEQSQNPL